MFNDGIDLDATIFTMRPSMCSSSFCLLFKVLEWSLFRALPFVYRLSQGNPPPKIRPIIAEITPKRVPDFPLSSSSLHEDFSKAQIERPHHFPIGLSPFRESRRISSGFLACDNSVSLV